VTDDAIRLTYVGGPTALIEWHGVRLLTDPTFDPAGTSYELPAYTLTKTQEPATITSTTSRAGGASSSRRRIPT
jgi:L-ascorbate metabolism protein UlaG (beta-lactamase superfamily)